MKKNYSWKVYYKNGDTLSQYNEDGSENRFDDIDESELVNFVLAKEHAPELNEEDYAICPSSGVFVLKNQTKINFGHDDSNRLIYFRRNRVDFVFGGNIKDPAVIHVMGLQATVDGKNKKFMLGIEDVSGAVVTVND